MGVSGRAMLDAIVAGQHDPKVLTELAGMAITGQARATAASVERTHQTPSLLYPSAHYSPRLTAWMKLWLTLMRKL